MKCPSLALLWGLILIVVVARPPRCPSWSGPAARFAARDRQTQNIPTPKAPLKEPTTTGPKDTPRIEAHGFDVETGENLTGRRHAPRRPGAAFNAPASDRALLRRVIFFLRVRRSVPPRRSPTESRSRCARSGPSRMFARDGVSLGNHTSAKSTGAEPRSNNRPLIDPPHQRNRSKRVSAVFFSAGLASPG